MSKNVPILCTITPNDFLNTTVSPSLKSCVINQKIDSWVKVIGEVHQESQTTRVETQEHMTQIKGEHSPLCTIN